MTPSPTDPNELSEALAGHFGSANPFPGTLLRLAHDQTPPGVLQTQLATRIRRDRTPESDRAEGLRECVRRGFADYEGNVTPEGFNYARQMCRAG